MPSREAVYERFKEYCPVNDNSEQLKEIVKEILHYAKYYVKMVLLKDRDPRTLEVFFRSRKELQTDAPYPFLLEVYDDYNQERIENIGFHKNPSTRRELHFPTRRMWCVTECYELRCLLSW